MLSSSSRETTAASGAGDEYEESILLVELQGLFEHEIIERDVDQGRCRIAQLNTNQPLIQIGSNVFVGRWERTSGTDLLFKEIPHRQMLSFVGSSEQRLVAQRVLLNPKGTKKRTGDDDTEETDDEIEEIQEENAAETTAAISGGTKMKMDITHESTQSASVVIGTDKSSDMDRQNK